MMDAHQFFAKAMAFSQRLRSKPAEVQKRYRRFADYILQRQPLPF